MASLFYNNFFEEMGKGNIDLTADTIKVALVTATYTPDADLHDFFDDITNEVVGTGYTAGGETLASKTLTQDNTNDQATFDAADTSWASSTITARAAILYKSTGVASTSALIRYIDFGSNISSTAAAFTITWNASGILVIKTGA